MKGVYRAYTAASPREYCAHNASNCLASCIAFSDEGLVANPVPLDRDGIVPLQLTDTLTSDHLTRSHPERFRSSEHNHDGLVHPPNFPARPEPDGLEVKPAEGFLEQVRTLARTGVIGA